MKEDPVPNPDKTHEDRLRRMAHRQGLTLQKSRTRDPSAVDYGQWLIIDASKTVVAGGHGLFTADDSQRYLRGEKRSSPRKHP